MTLQSRIAVDGLIAPLNFLRPMEGRPATYLCDPPPGTPSRTGESDPRLVSITNGRLLSTPPSLDREGFAMIDAPANFTEFNDDRAIRRYYYPDVERLLRAVTGALLVVGFDHNIRNAARAAAHEAGIKPPVERAHNDFTVRSGRTRAWRELEARGYDADRWLNHRIAIVNLWRPIGRPVAKHPLALCSARSIRPEDLVVCDLIYRHRAGETYALSYDPEQQWYYYPDLRPSEAILIKCYDSAERGVARFTAHTAFGDPTSPAHAPERESIETRALVVYR